MSRWKLFNPNPRNQRVGDCPIRAITKALDSDWETVFAGVTVCACALSDLQTMYGGPTYVKMGLNGT